MRKLIVAAALTICVGCAEDIEDGIASEPVEPGSVVVLEDIAIESVDKARNGYYVLVLSRNPSPEWKDRFKENMGFDHLLLSFSFDSDPVPRIEVYHDVDRSMFRSIRRAMDETNGAEMTKLHYFPEEERREITNILGISAAGVEGEGESGGDAGHGALGEN